MKCIFINNIVKSKDDKIKYIQLAEHNLYSSEITYTNHTLSSLHDLYNKVKDDKNIYIDFSYERGELRCEPTRAQIKNDLGTTNIINEECVKCDFKTYDIFALLYDIASNRGVFFIDSTFLQTVPFIPQYDRETGVCYIKANQTEYILIDSFNLLSNSFFFAVPANTVIAQCKFVKDIKHLDEKYSIYKYEADTLPIQVNNPDTYKYCVPLINKYMNLIYQLSLQRQVCDIVISLITRTEKTTESNNHIFKYFKLEAPVLDNRKLLDLWKNLTLKVFPPLLNANPNMGVQQIPAILKSVGSLPEPLYSVGKLMCYAILNGGFTPLDQLTYYIRLHEKCLLQLFSAQTFILRIALIIHIKYTAGVPIDLPDYLTGSNGIYNTKLIRSGFNDSRANK